MSSSFYSDFSYQPPAGFDYNTPIDYQVPTASIPSTLGGGGAGGVDWQKQLPGLLSAGGNLLSSLGSTGTAGGVGGYGYPTPQYEDYDPEPVEKAIEKVNTEYEKALEQIAGIFNDIAYLTGTNLPTGTQAFRDRFAGVVGPMAERNYNFLRNYEPGQVGQIPLEDYSKKAVDQVFGTASRASALNRPEYMAQATNPSTVTIDPAAFESSFQPYKDSAKSQDMFDYTNAATQALMTAPKAPPREPVPDIPEEYKRGNMAKYYANSDDVNKLMKFGSYFDVA